MNELEKAIALREAGNAVEAKRLLLQLYAAEPYHPEILYQCAWVHDTLGEEKEAIPFYRAALEHGLGGKDRRGALLGLGSTYRTLGQYES